MSHRVALFSRVYGQAYFVISYFVISLARSQLSIQSFRILIILRCFVSPSRSAVSDWMTSTDNGNNVSPSFVLRKLDPTKTFIDRFIYFRIVKVNLSHLHRPSTRIDIIPHLFPRVLFTESPLSNPPIITIAYFVFSDEYPSSSHSNFLRIFRVNDCIEKLFLTR